VSPVRRWGARVGAVGALCVLLVACSGGDAGGDGAEDVDGELPGEVCVLLDRLEDSEDVVDGPEVLSLDEAALAEALAARRAVLEALVRETDGDLRSLLEERVAAQPAVDEAMLAGWDEDRVRFAGEHNDRWLGEAVGQGVRRDDGEAVDIADFWVSALAGYQRLIVGCRAPELAGGPEQETSEDPPPGRLAFFRPADPEVVSDDGGQVVVTTELGARARTLEVFEMPAGFDGPREWDPRSSLEATPTRGGQFLVNVWADDEFALVEASLDGTIVDVVQRSAVSPIACPGWDARGERVLAAVDSARADERVVLLLDPTGATPSGPAPLPFATAGCSDFVTDDRIVVSDAALDLDGERAVWTVGVDGSDPQELYRAGEGCGTQVGSVDPAGTRVALAQTCDDQLGSGIIVVDLATGEAQRVTTGMAALPKWSPDGGWLVFGYAPLGDGAHLGTWIARPDGSQLREVVGAPAWFPAWLPPARETDAAVR
jgi:hypothetical protein